MNSLRGMLLLVAKDLRAEASARHTIGLVVVLGILIVAVLALGLEPGGASGAVGAPAILWVAYLFGGVLCFERTMAMERQDDALAAILLAPIGRGAIFGAKLIANTLLLLGVAAVVTPVAVVLFRFDLSAAPLAFAATTALGLIGFAAIGTLFAALVSSARLPGGLLPMLIFPLCTPLVLTSTRELAVRLEGGPALPVSGAGILAAFDVVFIVAGWLLFELVLEP